VSQCPSVPVSSRNRDSLCTYHIAILTLAKQQITILLEHQHSVPVTPNPTTLEHKNMTRKHYVEIAEIIKHTHLPAGIREELVAKFVSILRTDNPRFDRSRFEVACGVK